MESKVDIIASNENASDNGVDLGAGRENGRGDFASKKNDAGFETRENASANSGDRILKQVQDDNVQDASESEIAATEYATALATQLRKGMLSYCVLLATKKPSYTSDIIGRLRDAELVASEGTIYPLLARLQKDGLLSHEWQESEQGPPRKYYSITDFGRAVERKLAMNIHALNQTIKKLEEGK